MTPLSAHSADVTAGLKLGDVVAQLPIDSQGGCIVDNLAIEVQDVGESLTSGSVVLAIDESCTVTLAANEWARSSGAEEPALNGDGIAVPVEDD